MSRIIISKLAVEKITKDPKFRQLRESGPEGAVPIFFYYQRSYSTLKDGSLIEHGDGFGLNFIDPKDIKASQGIAYESNSIGDGVHVIVSGPAELLSSGFNIDWSDNKFALGPATSPKS